MTISNEPLIILPAAGFGTRVGSPNAKEIMLNAQGTPLIEEILLQAKERRWPVLVVTREAKVELIQYLEKFKSYHHLDLRIQLVAPTKEWPETILKTQPLWRLKNILVLPDTQFTPTSILEDLDSALTNKNEIAFAGVSVLDCSWWGVVNHLGKSFMIAEKPLMSFSGDGFHVSKQAWAWGLIGFSRASGQELFEKLLNSSFDHQYYEIHAKSVCLELTSFWDWTREKRD